MNSINTKNIKRNFPNNIYEKGFRDKRGDKSDNQQGNSKKIQKVLRQQCKDIFKTDRTTDYSFFEKSKMIEINKSNIREFLEELDFSLKEGEELTYSKNYRKHNNYEIEIVLNENDFKKSKINYGTEINGYIHVLLF